MGESQRTRDVGHEFSKYRLQERLSESFLGHRYRAVTARGVASAPAAEHEQASRRGSAYALRLLRADTPSLIDRAARAAKAVRYVDHPNVLAPIQLIRAQTKLGVITQDVAGATLSEILRLADARGDALPQAVALCIALDVLEGLMALHAMEPDAARYRYACGGLTPDSVHLGSDGRSRLIDPGVMGAAAGVPYWGHDPVALAYTAPEQTGPDPQFTPETDAFAVAVMLWEMLSGEPLFGARTAAETLVHLHTAPIPRVQRPVYGRGEPVAAALAQVLSRALSRERSRRFVNVRELAAALRDAGEVANTLTVAEYCERLASNSGAFVAAAPAPSDLFAEPDEVTDRISLSDQLAPPPPLGRANPAPRAPRPTWAASKASDSAWPAPLRGRPRYYAPFALAAGIGLAALYFGSHAPEPSPKRTAPVADAARAPAVVPLRVTTPTSQETSQSAATAPPPGNESALGVAIQPPPTFELAPMPSPAFELMPPQATPYSPPVPQPADVAAPSQAPSDPALTRAASADAPAQAPSDPAAARVASARAPAQAPSAPPSARTANVASTLPRAPASTPSQLVPIQPQPRRVVAATPVAPTFGVSAMQPASETARALPGTPASERRAALEPARAQPQGDAPAAVPMIWIKPASAPGPLAAQPKRRASPTTHSVETLLTQPQ